MHVSWHTVARWERGIQRPSPLALVTLRRVLMVPDVARTLSDKLAQEVPHAATARAVESLHTAPG